MAMTEMNYPLSGGGGLKSAHISDTYTSQGTKKFTLGFRPTGFVIYFWASGLYMFDYYNDNGTEKLYLSAEKTTWHNDRTSTMLGNNIVINDDGFTMSGITVTTNDVYICAFGE